MKIINKR